ncbi:hypothetical protein F383_09972 [Gossypium arboreum]|uniref:Uncharacterized protein n=1 Tax=Gossypium arboreum TaxID=29729 RepID=A0A0B0M9M4_GOSAR|nr:hypothetical protein F383_36884 [Gossypium arboreum]KHG26382.1 hypothetical protein F383_09972 [Gossypium arboreum]
MYKDLVILLYVSSDFAKCIGLYLFKVIWYLAM